MELQWPLILFTTFVAWSAGLFAAQGVCALRGECAQSQMRALIVSAVLLIIGGIAVFFHLEHWERIFNGFGHLSSGITQELIAVVIVMVVMVVVFAFLRRSANDPHLPVWLGAVMILVSVILVYACGHSYMMDSRPAWNTIFEVLSLIGAACILGPVTFALIVKKDEVGKMLSMSILIGSLASLVLSVAYLIAMGFAEYTQFDSTYFDPTSPTMQLVDMGALSSFSGDALIFSVLVIVGEVVAVFASLVMLASLELGGRIGKILALLPASLRGKQRYWKLWGRVALIAALLATVSLRIDFYVLGYSVFAFY